MINNSKKCVMLGGRKMFLEDFPCIKKLKFHNINNDYNLVSLV